MTETQAFLAGFLGGALPPGFLLLMFWLELREWRAER